MQLFILQNKESLRSCAWLHVSFNFFSQPNSTNTGLYAIHKKKSPYIYKKQKLYELNMFSDFGHLNKYMVVMFFILIFLTTLEISAYIYFLFFIFYFLKSVERCERKKNGSNTKIT